MNIFIAGNFGINKKQMDYQASLSNSLEIMEKLYSSLEDSLSDLEVNRREGYFMAVYLSILEYSDELFYLLKNNRTAVLPIICRSIIEKAIDIELLAEDSTYMDRLEMNTLKNADRISEYMLHHKEDFDEKTVNRTIRNRRLIKERLSGLKEKGGVKPINGLLHKFKLSTISDEPVVYWGIDKMSQEIHTDLRELLHKYQNLNKQSKESNKGYLKAKRNGLKEREKLKYLVVTMERVLSSTRCVISKFELKYKRTIEVHLEEINEIRLEFIESEYAYN